jgi:hypothetical protein
MAARRVPRLLVALLGTLAITITLTSCTGSGYSYIKSSDFHTYFKVPASWKLYDGKAVLDSTNPDLSKKQRDRVLSQSWRTMFDANPKASIKHVARFTKYPTGFAVVTGLSADDSDTASDSFLRNYFINVDSALNDQTLTLLRYEPVNRDGGFHGSHLVAQLVIDNATPDNLHEARAITFDQIVMMDQSHTHVYGMILSCSSACYDDNQGKIESVIGSWTVKDS